MTKAKTRFLIVGMAFIVLLAAALFVLPTLGTTANAKAWDGTIASGYAGGSGTETDPYKIANGEQLAYFASKVNEGIDYTGEYLELTADIDLGGREWTPIGSISGSFSGNFSGDGHTISGVNVNVTDPYEDAGLFGFSTGVIMNVAVEGKVSGTSAVGGICGGNSAAVGNGIISACTFNGTVTGTGNNVGGICGYNFTNSKISSCFSSAEVNGSGEVGGICGYNEGGATVSGSISAGTASGNTMVGAVCGKNDGTLTDNYFDKSVCDIAGAKDVNDNVFTGGTTGLTTEELCGALPSGLSGWTPGRIETVDDAENARKRTITYTYPCPDGIGEAYSTDVKEYNFSVGEYPYWKAYTEISTPEEFNAVADASLVVDGSYVLTENIDFKGTTVSPIRGFEGRFSGDGHTISNVIINDNDEYGNIGLFKYNDGGTIMNLAVEGDIVGSTDVGGICGYHNGGTIFACTFAGSVKGTDSVGGICGGGNLSGRIENCFNSGTVTGGSNVGGLCGYAQRIRVKSSINVGKVSGNAMVGAVCGKSDDTLTDNYFDKSVCDIAGAMDVSGNEVTDGITGLTTEELCGALPSGLSGWAPGRIETVNDAENARKRTVKYTYPCPGIGEAYSTDVNEYNFSIDGGEDWQAYTAISTADDLQSINSNRGGCYVLMKDVDLEGKSFEPIIPRTMFLGKISGDGHTIKNGTITGTERGGTFTGLFGFNKGLIMYLSIKADVSGSDWVGAFCGGNSGTIYGCSFEGRVEGRSTVGGICGRIQDGEISSCYVIGSVEATNTDAGGISAVNDEDTTIKNCYFSGTVTVSDGNQKDAISSNAAGITNCCYNSDLYTADGSNGTGWTTFEMTSSDAFTAMGLNSALWTKQPNDINGGNGTAYYPSLSVGTHVPSVEYQAEVTFEKADDKPVAYLTDFKVSYGVQIVFDNGGEKKLDGSTCEFVISGEVKDGSGTDSLSVPMLGENTYTLVCSPKNLARDFLAVGGLTKDLTVNAGKRALTADDFDIIAPNSPKFDGKAKNVTVKPINSELTGYGDITVKYFNISGDEVDPIDVGEYTVKIDVAEGDNCLAAENLTADAWKFAITKADAPAVPDNGVNISWGAKGKKSIPAAGLPERMGEVSKITAAISGDGIIAAGSADYSDGNVLFTMGANTVDDIGKKGEITFTLTTQNYKDITYKVIVTLTAKGDQKAPGSDDFSLVLTSNGSNITAKIVTDLKGVEFSFDSINWSTVNTTPVGHDDYVVGSIRFAETDELNASPGISKVEKSGHGEMIHHEYAAPTCTSEGSVEYWECALCGEYFLDEDGITSTTLENTVLAKTAHKPSEAVHEREVPATCTEDGSYDEVVYCSVCSEVLSSVHKVIPATGHTWSEKFESDKTGHWHKCEKCDAVTNHEDHTSSGPATYYKAETCTVCGYVINPRKSSGGGGGGGSSRPSSPSDTKPSINGVQKTWADIASELSRQNGGSTIISLNGETTVPADVIKAIADNRIKAEFVVDSTRSWLVDGAKITKISAADFTALPGNADRSGLRGAFGADVRTAGTGVPADLKLSFRKEFAGQFANVYSLTDGKLAFQGCYKVGEDGSAVISGADNAGEYVVMVCEFSDLPGDMSNDGVLNALDAAAVLRDIVGTARGANPVMGDFNGDGTVNALDASAILRKIVAA